MSKREQIASRAAQQVESGRAALAPDGLAARLRAARTLRRKVRFPGTDIEIAIQVLSAAEQAESEVAALEAVRAIGIDDGKPGPNHLDLIGFHVTKQTLARALYETDRPDAPRLFASADDLEGAITTDELHALGALYTDARQALDPRPEELPSELLEEFIEAAKKKAETHWRVLVSAWPRSWLLSLVDQHATSLSSSSSTSGSDERAPLPIETEETGVHRAAAASE